MALIELISEADSLFKSRDYLQSRELYQQTAQKAAEIDDNSMLTEAYSMIARSFLVLNQKDDGRSWIEKAEKIATPEEPLGWSRYLGVRGRFEWQDDNLPMASETFKNMYEYCSAHKLHERAIDAARMVAIVGTHEEQIVWGKKAITEAEHGNMTEWLGPLWNNLGATYEEMGESKESLDAYLKAREHHWKYGDEKNKLIADWAVGHAYRLNGDSQQAEKWIQPLLVRFISIEDTEFIGWTHNELGEIECLKNNMAMALEHFRQAAEYLKKADMPSWDSDGYNQLLEKIRKITTKSAE